jgi:hypothetical protein
LINYGPLRSGREIVFESLNAARRSLRKRFDTSIRAVAHVANYLMSRRRALRKEAIPDALNVTFDEKLSRHSLHVRQPTYT